MQNVTSLICETCTTSETLMVVLDGRNIVNPVCGVFGIIKNKTAAIKVLENYSTCFAENYNPVIKVTKYWVPLYFFRENYNYLKLCTF
ncbi:hypothetical protein WH47_05017 [Habropoda laboriosa]|uniref:Uncharacterized protein n=1 Tax=Habropoda laboriosa TaxID=597456 RepID=A0A0L7RJW7_9HYME|nr:hypothetical protein WH47_05017 [Habropoda laboriosa]